MQLCGETRYGVSDRTLVESALARPQQAANYENADILINAYCYLACTMCVGEVVVTLDVRLYLRTRTVRAINRGREPEERIRFRSKNTIAREMLKRIAPHLPPDSA